MNITRCAINPPNVACGQPATITVDVQWAGPASRTVTVCVDVPGGCRFAGQTRVCQQKTGTSVLGFVFAGAFACAPGVHNLRLTVTATDSAGNTATNACFVTVSC